jgi:ABC-type transport system involved in cytochrome c biogenesis permease subunit
MKKYFPALVALVAILAIAATLRSPRNRSEFDLAAFGRLPLLVHGRTKPFDTLARTSLLMLQGRQRVTTSEGRTLPPEEWLLDVFFRPAVADQHAVFEIVNPDVLALLGLRPEEGAGGKRFSAQQLAANLGQLDRQARLADGIESAERSVFQRALVQLRDHVMLYQRLQQSFMPPGVDDYFEQLDRLRQVAPAQRANPGAHGSGGQGDAGKLMLQMSRYFSAMDSLSHLRPVPADANMADPSGWMSIGGSLDASATSGQFNPAALAFAEMGRAWQRQQPADFNRAVAGYRARLDGGMKGVLRRTDLEVRFNSAQPFYTSTVLYVLAFLLAVASWLKAPGVLGRAAFNVLTIAFVLTTAGVLTRMWLESRPPVTNLYSSALFVGWGAVALCLVLEYVYRNAIGSVAGGLIGFATLVIAHHLALGGDTLEMMRAVLDSNFWLATHVVTIAVGYSATFLAGFLAVIYVMRGVLTRSLDERTAATLGRMIYGVVCFATLFSFVGTILGGIWADQSWGRFWGWDPKENGALLIVIWNSVLLHVRWAGMVKTRGLACLAIFGNVVTAWSWFGVNMLGVGLHSYGFMDAAFWWLVAFVVSQLAIILVAAVPMEKWRSRLLNGKVEPEVPVGLG